MENREDSINIQPDSRAVSTRASTRDGIEVAEAQEQFHALAKKLSQKSSE